MIIAENTDGPEVFPPGVGSSYRNGWRKLWKYFLELFLIIIVAFLLGIPGGLGSWTRESFNILDLLGIAYSILIGAPLGYGVTFAYLKAARGDKPEINDVFEAFKTYWNAVLASLLVGVIIGIGLVLLIIPGIIFASKLAFTPYLVVDRKMEVTAAIRESWQMTNGHAWKVFFIILLAIPVSIAGLLFFIVGIIIAVMWINLALASLYHAVSITRNTPEIM